MYGWDEEEQHGVDDEEVRNGSMKRGVVGKAADVVEGPEWIVVRQGGKGQNELEQARGNKTLPGQGNGERMLRKTVGGERTK
eukprot:9375169-Lingulodinium_polyedra.AAC.1